MQTFRLGSLFSLVSSLLILGLCLCCPGTGRSQMFGQTEPDPSLIRLIAAPQSMHGRELRTKGFIDVERSAVFVSQVDAEHSLTKNGIWLDVPDFAAVLEANPQKYRYCSVEGEFDMHNLGPDNAYSGTLTNVTRIMCTDVNDYYEHFLEQEK